MESYEIATEDVSFQWSLHTPSSERIKKKVKKTLTGEDKFICLRVWEWKKKEESTIQTWQYEWW